jgi:2-haloacid dehalogenase
MASPSPIFVFDAFGTLFDVHSAVRENADVLGDAASRVSDLWRAKQLEYTWIYAGIDQSLPFREITLRSLHYALAVCGVNASVAPQLLGSYQALEPFPEVARVLTRLKAEGAALAILSNGDTDMLDDLVANAGLNDVIGKLISVRVAGTFKPSPRVYALVTDVFKCAPDEIAFVSSNRWDIAGAKAFGFKTIWINRAGLPDEYPELAADRTLQDLTPLSI